MVIFSDSIEMLSTRRYNVHIKLLYIIYVYNTHTTHT